MNRLKQNLVKLKQWILYVVIGRFIYNYKYYSPFGECWRVYRIWFGFIPITYIERADFDMYDTTQIENYVNELNAL